ncbi:Diacylglycerol kinase 7 [Forsythia ovata]|uniref:Diacylglycerol kinase 7 n=1 Tax=Forsythia ovata TaxID=205694 RepID=A0ABD1TPB0_9LAMI
MIHAKDEELTEALNELSRSQESYRDLEILSIGKLPATTRNAQTWDEDYRGAFSKLNLVHQPIHQFLMFWTITNISGIVWRYLFSKPIAAFKITRSLAAKAFQTSLPLCKENFLLCRNGEPSGSTASSILFELRGGEWAEAYMQMDGEPWKQLVNKEFLTFVETKHVPFQSVMVHGE